MKDTPIIGSQPYEVQYIPSSLSHPYHSSTPLILRLSEPRLTPLWEPLAKAKPSAPSGLVSTHKKASRLYADEFGNHLPIEPFPVPPKTQRVYISQYRMDVTIKRKWSHTCQVGGGKRKKITGLSQKAQENMLFKARNCEGFKVLITLTYPAEYPHDGTLVKYHWKRMKQWLTRRGFQGFWFLEFQKRGAPHYHIFLTGYVDIKAVQKMWYDVVASGDEKHLRAGVRVEKIRMEHCAAAYAAKYAGKREQKEVPADYQNVGRFWGLFGGLKPTLYARSEGENKGEMAQRVRALKRLYQEYRKRRGLGTPRKDKGLYSFKLWGISTWAQMDVFRCAEGRLASSPTFAT